MKLLSKNYPALKTAEFKCAIYTSNSKIDKSWKIEWHSAANIDESYLCLIDLICWQAKPIFGLQQIIN